MIERRTFTWHGIEHPAFEARGDRGGRGCRSSIAAVTRVMNELDTRELAGSITAVPVVSLESFRRRSPFVVPEDGKNLNRSFPGSSDGTYTDVLARSIYDDVIAPADVLLDLHGGDQVEGLEPFAIYEASPVEERAHAVATAFNLPYVVREEPREGGLGGMTTSAAAAAGIAGVIAEAGGRGLLEEPWDAAVGAGDEVVAGALLGRMRDLWGDVLEEIEAPQDGVVLFITTSPAVAADGLLLGLGAELA